MGADRTTRVLAIAALCVAVVALVLSIRAVLAQRDHERQIDALGDLIRRSSATGRPVMDMGPPGGGRPELDPGE